MRERAQNGGIAVLVEQRGLALVLGLVAALQVVLVLGGLPGLPCPLLAATGVPCPGCGMSRACAALISGEWSEALRLHALAPVAALLLLVVAALAMLPSSLRERAARIAVSVDALRAVPLVALSIVLVYWLVRLALGWRG